MNILLRIIIVLLIAGTAVGASAAFGRWFKTDLRGSNEVAAVSTNMTGKASVKFNKGETEADFSVRVQDGIDVTQAHLHCAPVGQNGPVVAFLFGNVPGGFDVDKELAHFTLTAPNIIQDAGCNPTITTMAQLAQAIRDGRIYVNVHTVAHPSGEIRGQLHE